MTTERRGHKLLSKLQAVCLAVMEQPKNAVKGDLVTLNLRAA